MFKPISRLAIASLTLLSAAGLSAAFAQCAVTGSDPVPICRTSSATNTDISATLDSHKSFTSKSVILGKSMTLKK